MRDAGVGAPRGVERRERRRRSFDRTARAIARAAGAAVGARVVVRARASASADDDEARAVTIGEAEMRATCGACEGMGAFVRAAAGRRRDARGLELASGTGTFLREMRERGFKMVGVDPRIARTRDRGGDLAAKGVATAASLRRLPYRRAFFDYVVAFEPFGKMEMKATKENVDPVINEATRVAKKGAMMVFALAKTLDGGSRRWATATKRIKRGGGGWIRFARTVGSRTERDIESS